MRIVRLNEKYLEKVIETNRFFNAGGELKVSIDNKDIYIPMSSKIKYDKNRLEDLNYPLFNIGRKRGYGTLIIKDYIYIHHSLVEEVEKSELIDDELRFFKENKNVILAKLKRRVVRYIKYDSDIKNLLNQFLEEKGRKAKEGFIRYANKLISSMATLEKIQ